MMNLTKYGCLLLLLSCTYSEKGWECEISEHCDPGKYCNLESRICISDCNNNTAKPCSEGLICGADGFCYDDTPILDECPEGDWQCPYEKNHCIELTYNTGEIGSQCLACLDDSETASPDCSSGEYCQVIEDPPNYFTGTCIKDCRPEKANPCYNGMSCNADSGECR